MKFKMIHENYNVSDLDVSLDFYEKALGLTEKRRKVAEDGSFIIVYVAYDLFDYVLYRHYPAETAVLVDENRQMLLFSLKLPEKSVYVFGLGHEIRGSQQFFEKVNNFRLVYLCMMTFCCQFSPTLQGVFCIFLTCYCF